MNKFFILSALTLILGSWVIEQPGNKAPAVIGNWKLFSFSPIEPNKNSGSGYGSLVFLDSVNVKLEFNTSIVYVDIVDEKGKILKKDSYKYSLFIEHGISYLLTISSSQIADKYHYALHGDTLLLDDCDENTRTTFIKEN